jgi:hypothetical protein
LPPSFGPRVERRDGGHVDEACEACVGALFGDTRGAAHHDLLDLVPGRAVACRQVDAACRALERTRHARDVAEGRSCETHAPVERGVDDELRQRMRAAHDDGHRDLLSQEPLDDTPPDEAGSAQYDRLAWPRGAGVRELRRGRRCR